MSRPFGFLVTLPVVTVLAAVGPAFAHHTEAGRTHTMATVRIVQPVLAGGQPLEPGTYEVIVTDRAPADNAGRASDVQRVVEFVQNRRVVATEVAEVIARTERDVVGTAGSAGSAAARVELLKGGEFLRIAISDPGARYLIHLPAAGGPLQP